MGSDNGGSRHTHIADARSLCPIATLPHSGYHSGWNQINFGVNLIIDMKKNMVYQLGEQTVDFNNILGEIRSSYPHEDISLLYERLNTDGYLCLRKLIPHLNFS